MSLLNPTGMKAIDVATFTLEFVRSAAHGFKDELAGARSELTRMRRDIEAIKSLIDGSKIAEMQRDLTAVMEKHIRLSIELENKLAEKRARLNRLDCAELLAAAEAIASVEVPSDEQWKAFEAAIAKAKRRPAI